MGTDSRPVRTSKQVFLIRVAQRVDLPLQVVVEVYEALVTELREAVTKGETVVLMSFGRFYRQDHKGHKVRFGRKRIDAYPVLKFSASRVINRQLARSDPVGTDPDQPATPPAV